MKTLSIQIKSNEAILVVLDKQVDGNTVQTNECTKFLVEDHTNSDHIKLQLTVNRVDEKALAPIQSMVNEATFFSNH